MHGTAKVVNSTSRSVSNRMTLPRISPMVPTRTMSISTERLWNCWAAYRPGVTDFTDEAPHACTRAPLQPAVSRDPGTPGRACASLPPLLIVHRGQTDGTGGLDHPLHCHFHAGTSCACSQLPAKARPASTSSRGAAVHRRTPCTSGCMHRLGLVLPNAPPCLPHAFRLGAGPVSTTRFSTRANARARPQRRPSALTAPPRR